MGQSLEQRLLGTKAKFSYLFFAAVLLLFFALGTKDLWTQEHRWADIVAAMFANHDFLHPSLNNVEYYDKPLLSYWFIAGFAALFDKLSTWALRLPSAIAGLIAIVSIYRLGANLRDRTLGLLAGWMLLTTFYFIFWARVSSADMLNMSGILLAITWYIEKKSSPNFFNYLIFCLVVVVSALCKGLIAPVMIVLAVLVDLILNNSWRMHLNFSLFFAAILSIGLYLLPFLASAHFGAAHYHENGLVLVWRENVLRYFEPFDHQGPFYTYFLFLPIYLLPWTLFFIPALFAVKKRWPKLSISIKWLNLVVLVFFVFLTLSGSRRNYYVLPLVPFALLMTADWILAVKKNHRASLLLISTLILFALNFLIAQPLWYKVYGVERFATTLKLTAEKIKPWSHWKIVLLDPESKVRFYLNLPSNMPNYNLSGSVRGQQTTQSLLHAWPMLKKADQQADTIYITREQYQNQLQPLFKNYRIIKTSSSFAAPIAFVPNNIL